MFLCLVLHLPEWRPIVDSIVNLTLKFEVYREKFDPSFSLVKNAKNSEPCEKEKQASTCNINFLPEIRNSFRAQFFQSNFARYAMFGIKIFNVISAF